MARDMSDGRHTITAIAAAGGVERLLDMLRVHAAHSRAQHSALRALRLLGRRSFLRAWFRR